VSAAAGFVDFRTSITTAPDAENNMISAAPRNESAIADSFGKPSFAKYKPKMASRTPKPLT